MPKNKKAYLVIEGYLPTIHKNEIEARHYITFVRDTSKEHKSLKGMFCLFEPSELKNGFINCIFKSI
jgi:hypothetical protein